MAIDLTVLDGIAPTIEKKLLAIAAAADKVDAKAKAAAAAVNGIKGERLSAVSAKAFGTPTAQQTKQTKTVESAYATAVKDLNARRADIAAAFSRGFAEREKQNAKIVQQIERASRTIKPMSAVNIAPTSSAASLRDKQKFYNDLFGAHNISTAPMQRNLQDVINRTTGAALKQAGSTALKDRQQFYNNLFGAHSIITGGTATRALTDAIARNTGTALQQASAATQRQQQQFYNNLFGAHNINTRPAAANLQQTINRITGAGIQQASARSQRAQQAMYDNLFGATPTARPAASGAGASAASAASSISRVTPAARNAASGINDLSSAMGRLNTSASFLRSDGLRWAKVLWALGGATLTAGAIVDAADAYTRLQNRLSVVAKDQAQVNQLTEDMARIANNARQPIEQTAKTFSRIDLAMQQLGRSQKDSMVITANVAKALKLGGATAGEAASAMLQLSQAFNKGKLDGDEFRSVMENSPIIANALADQLKVTRGELLKLAPLGKITATVMAEAIIGATDKINAAFGKLKPTIAESFTVMRNHAIMFFGELDKQLGVTAAMSKAIMSLAANLDKVTFVVMAVLPMLALLVGSKMLAGFAALVAFTGRTAIAIGAIRNPIVTATVALVNMGRAAVVSGIQMSTAFTTATTRAIAYQLALVRVTAAMVAVTNAARAMAAAMLAAFSFGNILMLIAVATAALIAFGDQMVINADTGENMRDRTIAAFQEIGGFGADVFNQLYDSAASAFSGIDTSGQTTTERVLVLFDLIFTGAAKMVDGIITVGKLLWRGFKAIIYGVGDIIYNTVALFANGIVDLVNGAIDSLNTLTSGANWLLRSSGLAGIVGEFGQIGRAAGIEYKNQAKDAMAGWEDDISTAAQDTYELLKQRTKERSAQNAADRKKDANLRAYDAAQAAKAAAAADKKKDKKEPKSDAEKRADIIKKARLEEEKALAVAYLFGETKERQAKIEEVNNKLAMKNYALLSGAEESQLRALIRQRQEAERTGKAMEAIYDNIDKPFKEYSAAINAANLMEQGGTLSADLAAAARAKVTHEYKNATDVTYKYTDALAQQAYTFGKVGKELAAHAAVQEAIRSRMEQGFPAPTQAEAQQIADAAKKMYDMNIAQQALTSTFEAGRGAQEGLYASASAIEQAYNNSTLSVASFVRQLSSLKAQSAAINENMFGITDPFEPMIRGFNQFVGEMPTLGQSMADAISSTLGNAVDNLSSTLTDMVLNFDGYAEKVAEALNRPVTTLDVMRYALADIVNMIGKEMINAVIKMGVQMAIQAAAQAALEKANLAASTAAQVSAAAITTAAWTPAATAASIATQGGAAATGLTGLQMAMIAAAGLALAMIPAFKDGGLVGGAGTGRSDSTLARLSRGEMVMNRDAVSNNYPLLQALNSGATLGGGTVVNTSVNITYADGKREESSTADNQQFANDISRFVEYKVQQLLNESTQQGHANYRGMK